MSIGGVMDYSKLAQQHRPQTDDALRAEVQRLHDTGLTAQDIHIALRLPLETVMEWLAQ